MRYLVLASLLLLTPRLRAQTLATTIDHVYDFRPSQLSRQQQNKKLPALDQFWREVGADTSHSLPVLRQALATPGHQPFFYFDGASLLLSCSSSPSDRQRAATAIARCDLADVQPRSYVQLISQLAQAGTSVTAAALKILPNDQFGFFIPEHATSFNQATCLAYMLLPQPTDTYLPMLCQEFSLASAPVRRSILTVLWLTGTCAADAFIGQVRDDARQPAAVRNTARELLAQSVPSDAAPNLQKLSLTQLQQVRKQALSRFSDEALTELTTSSRLIRQHLACP